MVVIDRILESLKITAYFIVLPVAERFQLWATLLKPTEIVEPLLKTERKKPVVNKSKVSARYNLQIVGKKLVVNCGSFKVHVDNFRRDVLVEGEPVFVTTNFGRERRSFMTSDSPLTTDHTPAQIDLPSVSFSYDEPADDFGFKYGDMKVVISRKYRNVIVWDVAITAWHRNRLISIGPGLPEPEMFQGIASEPISESGTETASQSKAESNLFQFPTSAS
jgi:hypothetical protein